MANDQPAGSVDHLIAVQCDSVRSTVTIQQPHVVFKPGDWIIWQFFGIPAEWIPWIEFSPGTSFLGPFEELSQSRAAVWGQCKEDPGKDPFVYRAVIQKGPGTAWETSAAVINSSAGELASEPDSGKAYEFRVTQGSDNMLDVTPSIVTIRQGDTVDWIFPRIEAEIEPWRPLVEFHRYDGGDEDPDLYLGPFTSLTMSADRIRGTGNNKVNGSFYFQASMVRISNNEILWKSSSDPVIDNRGGVVDPDGQDKRGRKR